MGRLHTDNDERLFERSKIKEKGSDESSRGGAVMRKVFVALGFMAALGVYLYGFAMPHSNSAEGESWRLSL